MKQHEAMIELINGIQDDLEYLEDKINYYEAQIKCNPNNSIRYENVEKIYKLFEEITKIV